MPRRSASSPSGGLPGATATEVARRPEYRVEALSKGLRMWSSQLLLTAGSRSHL